MQIPGIISSIITKQVLCILVFIFVILFLFVKLVGFITGWDIIGVLLILLAVYKLLRLVGTFALYPGSIKYIQADYQIRGSQRVGEMIAKNIQEVFVLLKHCADNPRAAYLHPCSFPRHVTEVINMLARFQTTLTQNKMKLLAIYRALDEVMKSSQTVEGIIFTNQQFLNEPHKIRMQIQQKQVNLTSLSAYAQKLGQKLVIHINQLNHLMHVFHPPQGLNSNNIIQQYLYRTKSQKLYQLRFAYMYWDSKFQYKIHLLQTIDSKAAIQCAVISSQKGKSALNNNCAIISGPNGAFLQYFALQSQYIKMYLDMDLQVVLWNYRGYGQSTGTPTISDCILDAQAVYNYSKRFLNLDPKITHGYSIGGPPAATLALNNPFNCLVVDRSFCNFVNIAHQISPILGSLAKLVMRADSNVNISQVYLKIVNCKKIMVWSAVDQVISHGSSLKLGVLNKLLKLDSNKYQKGDDLHSPTNLISESELHERQIFIEKGSSSSLKQVAQPKHKESQVDRLVRTFTEFFQMISSLYEAQKLDQSSVQTQQSNFNNNSLIQEVSAQLQMQKPVDGSTKDIINKFFDTIGRIDGGGTKINLLKDLAASGLQKQQQLHVEVRSFVLGLIYFGACYHDDGSIYNSATDNWPLTIALLTKSMQQLSRFLLQYQQKCPKQLFRYFKQVQTSLSDIKKFIEKHHKSSRNLGTILPTDSGHNGELSKNQLLYLITLLTNRPISNEQGSMVQMKQKEQIKQKQMSMNA